jgi:hypothetical protein
MLSLYVPTEAERRREQQRRELIATSEMVRDEAREARARSRETVVRARRALAACREGMAHIRAVRLARVAASGD